MFSLVKHLSSPLHLNEVSKIVQLIEAGNTVVGAGSWGVGYLGVVLQTVSSFSDAQRINSRGLLYNTMAIVTKQYCALQNF